MHLIPKSMMKIGNIPGEFDLPVEVVRNEENTVVQATDGHMSITVTFPRIDPQEYPSIKDKDQEYCDGCEPVKVPGKVWVEGLKSVKKSRLPILENAVVSSEGIFSTDLYTTSERQIPSQDEQKDFPAEALNQLLETAKKGDKFSIVVSPLILTKLFETILPLLDKKSPQVRITFPLNEGSHPRLLLSAKGEKGEEIEVLIATCKVLEEGYLHSNIRFFTKPKKS